MRATDRYRAKTRDDLQDILDFDWDPTQLKPLPVIKRPDTLEEKYKKISQEKSLDRIQRQILNLHNFVINCSMCHLGTNTCEFKNTVFDPHVFSNMNASKWVLVGQNPGFNECLQGKPFVGDSGKVFDEEIAKHGVSRDKFYISNLVKCYTTGNSKPLAESQERCEAILRMELTIIRPILVIALGAVSFKAFCPNLNFSENMGKIVKSDKFGVKVFPIYHPSPRNTNLPDRREQFEKSIRLLCKIVTAYDKKQK
jgi:DNA polymerase